MLCSDLGRYLLVSRDGKGRQIKQDQSSMLLLRELNLSHTTVVFSLTLKYIMLIFFSKMYRTLLRTRKGSFEAFISSLLTVELVIL